MSYVVPFPSLLKRKLALRCFTVATQELFNFLMPFGSESVKSWCHWVIDRKITQGTRIDKGQRYHERMGNNDRDLQQAKPQYLIFPPHSSMEAHLDGQTPPTLLPSYPLAELTVLPNLPFCRPYTTQASYSCGLVSIVGSQDRQSVNGYFLVL